MLAFHNQEARKQFYLNRVIQHRELDQLKAGYGWWYKGKGCAVGCTIHGDDPSRYEIELGIPEDLAIVEEHLFENMARGRGHLWPEEFLGAIPVGADLTMCTAHFTLWLLRDADRSALSQVTTEQGRTHVSRLAALFTLHIAGEDVPSASWDSAHRALRGEIDTLPDRRVLEAIECVSHSWLGGAAGFAFNLAICIADRLEVGSNHRMVKEAQLAWMADGLLGILRNAPIPTHLSSESRRDSLERCVW